MATLKLVEWNMEWVNDLFVPNEEPVGFRPDDEIVALPMIVCGDINDGPGWDAS